MLRIVLTIALAATAVQAQTASPSASSPRTAQQAYVSPGDPVITIHGLCAGSKKLPGAPDAKSCTTIISRKELDDLLDATKDPQNPMPWASRAYIARQYAEYLTFEPVATQAGVQNEAGFKALMRLRYIHTLEAWYEHDLEGSVTPPSSQEIETYYKAHLPEYEQADVHRIFIPNADPNVANPEEFAKKARAVADEMRERAAKGEDPDTLERAIDGALGLNYPPTRTEIGNRRKSSFPKPIDDDVFSLQPGQVTKIEEEHGGFAIYRLDSKQTLPVAQVQGDIVGKMNTEKINAEMSAIRGSVGVNLNDDYFNRTSAPSSAPPKTGP
jgi:hypothetical protein